MSRKRLRYSDLPAATPVEPTPAPPDAAVEEQVEAPAAEESFALDDGALEIVADMTVDLQARRPEMAPGETIDVWGQGGDLFAPIVKDADEPLLQVRPAAPVKEESGASVAAPARPRRNSTPVELARTLTAERAAARAKEGLPPEEVPDDLSTRTTPERDEQRTLRERARARSGAAELLMFRVGGERFAVELILVDEVIDLPVIHHVPEMPPAMLGVVTVRGSLTPVYSPQHALGLPLVLRDALLIFRRGAQRVGILIDDVDDALSADMSELRDTPAGDVSDGVLLGVIRLENSLVGIIDTDALIISCQSANILEPA